MWRFTNADEAWTDTEASLGEGEKNKAGEQSVAVTAEPFHSLMGVKAYDSHCNVVYVPTNIWKKNSPV